jgi:hypothetical protein
VNNMVGEREPPKPIDEDELWIQQLRESSGISGPAAVPIPIVGAASGDAPEAAPAPEPPPAPSDPEGAGPAKGRAKKGRDRTDSGSDWEDWDEESKTLYTRKMKELDKITVPSFPGINQLVNYRINQLRPLHGQW